MRSARVHDPHPGPAGGLRPWREVVRILPDRTRRSLRRHDVLLYGAGVTFYAALALVPLVLVTTWLAARVVGVDRMTMLADTLQRSLPEALDAGDVARDLLLVGLDLSPLTALVAVFPISLYGEGLRRAYTALAGADQSMIGWRGRLSVLPLLALAPLGLLAVLSLTPLLATLFAEGTGPSLLGIYLALNVDWVVLSVPLAFSYRVTSPEPPTWRVAIAGGVVTAAFVSGFLQGFVLFLSLPIDLGLPFGGLTAVGAVCALLLWVWLLHLVVLVGYAGTRTAQALRDRTAD